MSARRRCRVTGKWEYASSMDAYDAAVTRYRNVGRGQTQRAYLCPLCGSWHLSTKPKREGVAR